MWWAVAVILGPAATLLPDIVAPNDSEQTKLMVACAALFAVGGMLGYIAPDRPWRWGIACVLLLPIVEVVMKAPNSQLMSASSFLGALLRTRDKAPVYALYAFVVLTGAYLAAFGARKS